MRKKLWVLLISTLMLMFIVPSTMACGDGFNGNQVKIIRDNYGVPHIFARTKEGLAFGAGYAIAQDRLWQTDLYRRQGYGSMSELLGQSWLNYDIETRSVRYSKVELQEIFDNWEPAKPEAKLKEMMLAYVDGINYYINEAQMKFFVEGDPSLIPLEYLASGLLPIEPFTIADCVAIVVMMAWQFGGTGGGELGLAASFSTLNATYDPDTAWTIFNDLFPQVDLGAPTTIPAKGCKSPKDANKCSKPNLPANINEIYKEMLETSIGQAQMLESMGLPTEFGSNAWMVRPKKSKTGNAMQVGGPQMGHSIPQIVVEVGLHGAGINAVGMMMPHAPTILIGASDYGAWTSTTGSSDLIDTYIEEVNPDNPRQYRFNNEWVTMEERTETFYGPMKAFDLGSKKFFRTIHGPVIANDTVNNLVYTVKAPYYKNELAAEEGWFHFQTARNIGEFQEATKLVHAGHNFFWIDRRGNIGFWHAGTFPIKPELGKDGRVIDDRFPLWGTGEEEWLGVTGFEEMPKCINPSQGYLANWNNKPQEDWPYREADWGEVHGVPWIQEQLATGGKISFEGMNEINRDTGYAHFGGMYFKKFLINAAKNDPNIPAEVIEALIAWDNHYNDYLEPRWNNPGATYDDPGLTIFDAWYNMIFNAVFADDLPPGMEASPSTLLHVFEGDDSKLPMQHDYLFGQDRDEIIVQVLKDALVYLEALFETDVISTWLTSVRTVTFTPQGALPALTMHAMNRGTYNHIVEMPKWKWKHLWRRPPPHAVDVIPPGQSGFISLVGEIPTPSPHFMDQLHLYETWTYKPMLFRYKAIKNVAESITIMTY